MEKIFIILKHIECGGIASISIKLANMLSKNGYEVSIFSVCRRTDNSPYKIDPNVCFKELTNFDTDFLEKHNLCYRLLRKISEYLALKKLIKNTKEVAIITTLDEHNIFLSRFGNKETRKIAQVHHDHEFEKKQINNFKNKYGNLDYVVTVAGQLTDEIKIFLKGKSKADVRTISNFLQLSKLESCFDIKQNYVVAAGRFCNDKAFERLLEIWAKIIKVNKDWKLYLIGDGALRPIYEKIIEKYDMKDYVILTGFLSNSDTLNLIKKSKIYAMTSRTEAFPMTILESMSVCTAVIAFDVRVGPRTIISKPFVNGVLIKDGDIVSYCDNLLKLMSDDEYREKIALEATNRVADFSEENILLEWNKILK